MPKPRRDRQITHCLIISRHPFFVVYYCQMLTGYAFNFSHNNPKKILKV
ncbi:hypothetical protein PT2222_130291 [Paraburkholderia tropica]